MSGCCDPRAYGEMFDASLARKNARAYRKKGLDPAARQMVGFFTSRGLDGYSVLEVGGGVGAIQVELLRAGAATAVNVEMSAAYEQAAGELLAEAGLDGRVTRLLMDFAGSPDAVAPADLVVMHRVVCCYPDMEALVGAAAGRARRSLAMSYPRDGWWIRLGLRAGNLWYRLLGRGFRAYHHPPHAVLSVAQAHGLHIVHHSRGWIWELAVLERAA